MINKIEYPLLWISEEDNAIGIFSALEELTNQYKGGEQYLTTLKLITIKGKCFKIIRVSRTKEKLSLLQLLRFKKIKLRLDFSIYNREFTLNQLKQTIIDIMKEDIDLWDSDGRYDETSRLVKESKSFELLIDIIEKCYYNRPYN